MGIASMYVCMYVVCMYVCMSVCMYHACRRSALCNPKERPDQKLQVPVFADDVGATKRNSFEEMQPNVAVGLCVMCVCDFCVCYLCYLCRLCLFVWFCMWMVCASTFAVYSCMPACTHVMMNGLIMAGCGWVAG